TSSNLVTQSAADASATTSDSLAVDQLLVSQTLAPAVPVSVVQATLEQIAPDARLQMSVSPPQAALRDEQGVARGGLQLAMQSSLAAGLPGVVQWFKDYSYTCLEQQASRAIGLTNRQQWQMLMQQ